MSLVMSERGKREIYVMHAPVMQKEQCMITLLLRDSDKM